jgi:hypothetical protein
MIMFPCWECRVAPNTSGEINHRWDCSCRTILSPPTQGWWYTPALNQGWVCPKCENVWAPTVEQCKECKSTIDKERG